MESGDHAGFVELGQQIRDVKVPEEDGQSDEAAIKSRINERKE
jgi:hypothetical protein